MTMFENVGLFIRENVWLEISLREGGWQCRGGSADAGELPRRKHTTFRTRQKFEIKNAVFLFIVM